MLLDIIEAAIVATFTVKEIMFPSSAINLYKRYINRKYR